MPFSGFNKRLSYSGVDARRASTMPRRGTAVNLDDAASAVSDMEEKRAKFFTQIDVVSEEVEEDSGDYIELMANRLYKFCENKALFGVTDDYNRSATALQYGQGEYKTYSKSPILGWDESIVGLDAQAIIAIDNAMVRSVAGKILHTATDITIDASTTLQIFDTLPELRRARMEHPQAFIREEQLIVLWSNDAEHACKLASSIQEQILEIVWNDDQILRQGDGDLEKQTAKNPHQRPRFMQAPFTVSLAWAILVVLLGLLIRTLLIECLYDHTWYRFLFMIYYPTTMFMSMFFFIVVAGVIVQGLFPLGHLKHNSHSYSANPPKRMTGQLPHITIQCPVYKESLNGVIAKTVDSVTVAMRRYELQGGTCNLLISDDRMQLVDEESADFRKQYYEDNNIGWIARPGHNSDGFIRKGKFKKASNMNFTLNISMRVEELLETVFRHESWTEVDEQDAYDRILLEVLEENGRAQGAGNVRIGDIVLLIDSDTRVPTDCLLDAASEFDCSPSLAILQHSCGVLQVSFDFFENAITYFTNYIYRSITLCAGGGDVAPFVGHNAFLRWSAVQEIRQVDETGYSTWWSEDHVSEDFEMALKLQMMGYVVRLAGYSKGEFQEGVSLTIYDELARWEKYAYGCSELMFHPFIYWPIRGPFTKLFKTFVASPIPGFAKFTILAYIGTYYAIGAIWITTLANYFFTGWYGQDLDKAYLNSFKVFLSVIVVFNAASPLAHSLVRYRMGDCGFWRAYWENSKWLWFFMTFFGGLSLHVSKALIAHMFSLNMQWGATAKEKDNSNFFKEAARIFGAFKYTFLVCAVGMAGMLYLALWAPDQWKITNFNSCFPLGFTIVGHFVQPIVLNPQLFNL